MSRENVELIRSLHPPRDMDMAQSFRDDRLWAAMSTVLAPVLASDFRCNAHGYVEADRAGFEGVSGFRDMWLDWLTPWTSYRSEVEDMIDLGDDVLVLVRDFGRRTGDMHEVAISSAAIWTVREEKVAEVTFHADRSTAFDVAGLEG